MGNHERNLNVVKTGWQRRNLPNYHNVYCYFRKFIQYSVPDAMKTAINTSARFIPVPPLRRQNRRISSWLWWIGAILTARRLLRETLYLIGFGVLTIGLYAT